MEILSYAFFQKAIIILTLTSIISGIIGSLIVIKKVSMVSGSISHGAFGGLGIAYYLGLNPILGAVSFSLLGSFIISHIYRKYEGFLDTILTMFWAGGMAVGIIFIYITPGYATDLFSYLFGNVLLSSTNDLLFISIVCLIVIVSIIALYETLVSVLFNEEFAKLKGVKVGLIFTFFLVLISLSVVSLISATGIVLTIAMLTISPAISIRFLKKISQIMVLTVVINLITTLAGLFLAYFINFPIAPTIIMLQIVVYSLSLVSK